MDFSLDNKITADVVKAISEFNLIEDEDRIIVGLSGGKDSTFLLFVLKLLQLYGSQKFDLRGVYVDPGFSESEIAKNLKLYTHKLEVEFDIIETEIADFINNSADENPCSKCAHFRKGALVDYMVEKKFNKLAFGHHLDDAVETFLLNIFYSGQLRALQPLRYLSDNQVSIIRPLIYLREDIIAEEVNRRNFETVESSCPYDGNSARADIRREFAAHFKDKRLFANLVSAFRESNNIELWPEKMDYNRLKKKMNNFWN